MIRTATGPVGADAPAGLAERAGVSLRVFAGTLQNSADVRADSGGWSGRNAAKAYLCAANGTDQGFSAD